jgi:DNA mismatch repair protein MutS
MNFEMDQQSFDDLSIFGSTQNRFSVFEIYGKTRTAGGRDCIAEMMRKPTNDSKILHDRRDSIDFFGRSNFTLRINQESFNLILHYLNNGGVMLRTNIIDSFSMYVRSRYSPNQEYYNITIGLKHLIPLLAHSIDVAEVLIKSDVGYLIDLGKEIEELLQESDLDYAIGLAEVKELDFRQIAKADSIVRKQYAAACKKLLNIFYELDVLETLSKVVTENNYCLPSYFKDEQIRLEVKDLFHPALKQPIPSSLSIDENNNLMFLSGSNMSGKSTFLKALGLCIYLSHLGFPIPAKQVTTTVFNGLLTTINLPDNVQNGLSHYYSEVIRVKKIATLLAERRKMFILLDELFKGTNPTDAFDASLLVINGFAEIKNSIYIISSHITALTQSLVKPNITFKYLDHLFKEEKPIFTYQLKEGVAADGIGMYFIKNENIKRLLDTAKDIGGA